MAGAVALGVACSASSQDSLNGDGGFQIPQCPAGSPFNIDGTAGVQAILNVHINAMGLVDTEATASLLLLLQITQTGRDVAVVAYPCDIQIPDVPVAGQDKPVHFDLGPGLIQSVMPVSGHASLDGDTTCAKFTSDPITLLLGARMNPKTTGTLPEADSTGAYPGCLPATDDCYTAITYQCACDQEQDGNPGATLLASNIPGVPLDQVYVDLRSTFSLDGQVWSSDQIRGEVTASLEQGILGCRKMGGTPCSAGEVTLVKNLNPKITPSTADPSIFRAVRVDPQMTCDQLKAMKDQLFPR
jgi:hypothetical protein